MFSAHLAEYPNDFSTRWLLNIAHMTLGEYPDKVNPQYLIPPEKFASEYDLPRFLDVSDGLGIDVVGSRPADTGSVARLLAPVLRFLAA